MYKVSMTFSKNALDLVAIRGLFWALDLVADRGLWGWILFKKADGSRRVLRIYGGPADCVLGGVLKIPICNTFEQGLRRV